MFIRYLGNIHNLNKYYSLVKNIDKSNVIFLKKDAASNYSLEFKDQETRDFILNEIWLELKKGSQFYDIDEIIETYNASRLYNL